MNKASSRELALVTGASSGIGLEMARQLAASGRDLVLVARSAAKLEALAQSIKSESGAECTVIPADLSKPGAAAALKAECDKRGLQVDILANVAGVGLFGAVLEQDQETVRSMVRLNIDSLTELSVLFGRDMASRGRGRILNVASMVALMPVPFFSTYAASKAYVTSFTASLRAELRKKGVSATCLLPGYVKTNFDAASNASNEAYLKMSASIGMDPAKVARIGLRAMARKRGRVVVGFTNKIGAFFIGMIPGSLIARVVNSALAKLLSKS